MSGTMKAKARAAAVFTFVFRQRDLRSDWSTGGRCLEDTSPPLVAIRQLITGSP